MILKLFGIEIRTGADLVKPVESTPPKVEQTVTRSVSTDVVIIEQPSAKSRSASSNARTPMSEVLGQFFSDGESNNGIKMTPSARGRNRKILANSIVYPAAQYGSSLIQRETHNSNVESFAENIQSTHWFSISGMNKLMESGGISHNRATKESYEYLRAIHCKDYSDMDDRQYALMIACIKHVLSDGETPDPNSLLS